MRIRPLRLSDLAAASALQQRAFPHDAWSLQSLRDELGAGAGRWWVVAESGPRQPSILGLAGSASEGEVVDVLSLAVDPAARRQGIGRTLLTELVAQARSTGAERVLLEVAVDNDAARALYDAAGFTAIARRRGYFAGPEGPATVDALVLQLTLSRAGAAVSRCCPPGAGMTP